MKLLNTLKKMIIFTLLSTANSFSIGVDSSIFGKNTIIDVNSPCISTNDKIIIKDFNCNENFYNCNIGGIPFCRECKSFMECSTNNKNTIFEGDMFIDKDYRQYIKEHKQKNERIKRSKNAYKTDNYNINDIYENAIRNNDNHWTSNIIPYNVSGLFSYKDRSIIRSAMNEIERKTCIKFKKYTDEEDYFYIFKGSGCYSSVGRNGGKQYISLGNYCVNKGIIIHELLHTLGLYHEQGRNDRNDYVDIIWKNINEVHYPQFEIFSLDEIDHLGQKYDYDSIMHYSAYAFTIEWLKKTIIPKQKNITLLGSFNKKQMSKTDEKKINIMYCNTSIIIKKEKDLDKCKDKYPIDCLGWGNSCYDNALFMRYACAKTCNYGCNEKTFLCIDKDKNCKKWAIDDKFCNKSKKYMDTICPVSCNKCIEGNII